MLQPKIQNPLSYELDEAENSNIEHEKYHENLQEVIAYISQLKRLTTTEERELRLAKNWLIYTDQLALSNLSKLKCRQIALTSPVKEVLCKSTSNSNYDLIDEFTSVVDDSASAIDVTAAEVYNRAYNVFHSVKSKLEAKAENDTLDEWTLMIDTVVELVKAYVTTYCKNLFDIEYDNTIDGGSTRPDFKIYLDENHSLPILLCEVSKEAMGILDHFTVVHKAGMKLPTTMQQLLRKQLRRVPIESAGIFGILVGQFDIRIVFMKAICKNNLWAFPIHQVGRALNMKQPRSFTHFFNALAQVEAFAQEVKRAAQTEEFVRHFPIFPENPEPGRKSTKEPKIDQNTGNNNTNSGSSRQQKAIKQQFLPNLEGRLKDVREFEENCYSAIWKLGDKAEDVFIITKTACDTREIEFLKEINCRTIVKLLHSDINSQTEGNYYLIMPQSSSYTNKCKDEVAYTLVLPFLEVEDFVPCGLVNHLIFARDILEAMDYIHAKHIVHRDIKPSNIGRTLDGNWILLDFNNATRLLEENNYKSFSEGVGTEDFMAPEVMKVDPQLGYDCKADLFSFGKVLLEMCQTNSIKFYAPIQLIADVCTRADPKQRPEISDLLQFVQLNLDKVMLKKEKQAAKKTISD